jgi:hypothetical protein
MKILTDTSNPYQPSHCVTSRSDKALYAFFIITQAHLGGRRGAGAFGPHWVGKGTCSITWLVEAAGMTPQHTTVSSEAFTCMRNALKEWQLLPCGYVVPCVSAEHVQHIKQCVEKALA